MLTPQCIQCSVHHSSDCTVCVVPSGGLTFTRGADELVLSLASEPMYDVVVYLQSGPFFDGTPSSPPAGSGASFHASLTRSDSAPHSPRACWQRSRPSTLAEAARRGR